MGIISQKKQIITCLKRRPLSVRDIFVLCNCNSPTKRISELRREGYHIEDRWQEKDGKRWKVYILREERTA